MSREGHFVETIRVSGGVANNLNYHQVRMDATVAHFFPNVAFPPLEQIADRFHPLGLNKLRVVYGPQGIECTECEPYSLRTIRSLKIVDGGEIDYSYKSTDRSQLDSLKALCDGCDDVVIIRRGLVTDTSFTNIAIFDGNSWLTPEYPLLKGTRRASLLDMGKVAESPVTVRDLLAAKRIRLFNSMIEFGDIELDAASIRM
ncbi:MAG: aminotransferase class IV [Marinilabiliaceae bacterium]